MMFQFSFPAAQTAKRQMDGLTRQRSCFHLVRRFSAPTFSNSSRVTRPPTPTRVPAQSGPLQTSPAESHRGDLVAPNLQKNDFRVKLNASPTGGTWVR